MLIAKSRIKHDGSVYVAGDELPVMSEKQAKALIEAGAAEDRTPASAEPAKKTVAPVATQTNEPSMEWTRAKLMEYAKSHGVEVADEAVKKEILEAIQKGKKDTTAPAGSPADKGDDVPPSTEAGKNNGAGEV